MLTGWNHPIPGKARYRSSTWPVSTEITSKFQAGTATAAVLVDGGLISDMRMQRDNYHMLNDYFPNCHHLPMENMLINQWKNYGTNDD